MSSLDSRVAAEAAPNVALGNEALRRKTAIFSVLTAMMLVVLDATTINVALPTIAESMGVTPGMSVLVVTAYQLGLVMALLPCAALGESLGYRPVFRAGVLVFAASAFACSIAPTFPWLIAARFIQGLGGAAVMSLGIALVRQVVAPSQLAAAIGWNALVVALSSAAGPALGAFVLSAAHWQWLFILSQPIALSALAMSHALPTVRGNRRSIDAFSAGLNATVFASFVMGAELLSSRPDLAVSLLVMMAVGSIVLARRELRAKSPLVPIDLLKSWPFRISIAASVCCFAGQTAAMVALPFYIQHGFHQSALMSGLLIMPWPLAVAVAAPIAGRLANRVSGAWLCAIGGATLATGLAAASLWPLQSNVAALVPIIMLCGLGFGLFQVPNNRNMFLAAPLERSGSAGGMQGTARLTGQTMGAVIMSVLFTNLSAETALKTGFALAATLTLAAGLVSILRLPPKSDT